MFRDRARHEPPLRVWLDVARDLIVTVPREQAHVLMNDLRYALRTIRRTPAFSAAVMLTVAIVTTPFRFEGARRGQQADEGIAELSANVDTLVTIPNDRLLQVLGIACQPDRA